MQNVSAAPDMKLDWPWQPEDVAPDRDEDTLFPAPWWHRLNPSMVVLWVVGVIVCIILMNVTAQAIYAHQLQTQGQWIAQQSQGEVACLNRAQTDDARTTCARKLANAVIKQDADFASNTVAFGYANQAAQMQSAFAALYGAACYDSDSHSVDDTCLQHMAPSLRQLAALDVAAAEHK